MFDKEQYVHGRCHIFALAMSEELGYGIRFLWDEDAFFEDDGDGQYGLALVHAFCIRPNGSLVDAQGTTSEAKILDEFEYNEPVFQDVQNERVIALINERFLDESLENEIDEIRQYIRETDELKEPKLEECM